MSNLQSVLLVLKTSDLTLNTTNSVGICDARRTNMTWLNINLRTLLGDMWDKYDNFNLILCQITNDGGNPTANGVNALLNLNISGLPLVNGFYDTVNKMNTNTAIIGCFNQAQTNNTLYGGLNSITFNKTQEQVNLNLFYTSVSGQSNATLLGNGLTYLNATFIFKIVGCNINNSNITEKKRITI